MRTLKDLLIHELSNLQDVELQILQALPRMIDKAEDPALGNALASHLAVTERQLGRVERLLRRFDDEASGRRCIGMATLVEEARDGFENVEPEALDAAIIGGAQKIEHYEIAAYGTALSYARILEDYEAVDLLEETLEEEKGAEEALSLIAEMNANAEAPA